MLVYFRDGSAQTTVRYNRFYRQIPTPPLSTVDSTVKHLAHHPVH